MDAHTLRIVEHIHGHVGWLSAAALVHPAIVLRRQLGGAWAVGLSTGLVTLNAAMGVWLYGPYCDLLKRHIFQSSPTIGLLFERKEHLAFGAVLLAWVGAIAHVGKLRALSQRAYLIAALLAIAVASLGTIVAS